MDQIHHVCMLNAKSGYGPLSCNRMLVVSNYLAYFSMLLSPQKSEGQDSICHKNQLYQIEKYKANKDSYEVKLINAC